MKGFNPKAPRSKTKKWQIRWNEPLGVKECPYAFRWVLITPFFSIRIHNFIRSDDKRYFHDHAWDFYTFILKGFYWDISEVPKKYDDLSLDEAHKLDSNIDFDLETKKVVYKQKREQFKLYKVKAEHAHYVSVPKGGCWTLVFCTKPRRKWGFWVDDKFKRPLKYFHKFGHPPCSEQ